MYRVVVEAFGSVDQMRLVEQPVPSPQGQQVVVRLMSIGMNHADLMARRGEYRLISGDPPFTPGLEGGGYIEQVGPEVSDRHCGQRVTLRLDASASQGLGQGTYRSHYLVEASQTVLVPAAIADDLIGAIWLSYATAWGCLIWQQQLQPGQSVLIPAASSSVAIAAAQIVKQYGGLTIGTTRSAEKANQLGSMPAARYDHLVVTDDADWWRQVKQITQGRGVDVIFDPIAAGSFLNQEIRLLAPGGTLWIYGLLGQPDVVDVAPLIRKQAAIRGWLFNALSGSDREQVAYTHILEGMAAGTYQLPVAKKFALHQVRQAHTVMAQGQHVGKLILVP
ncbi:MAG: zinc-binding dehydrogenase [Almyronema sp.]